SCWGMWKQGRNWNVAQRRQQIVCKNAYLSQPARVHIRRTLRRFPHAAQAVALRVGVGMQR
ncbi:MAG: hypothetical protein OEV18_15550, partial [Deltaproteobacteria bacterium]|nr:hypothetical protein [Deltaproteobacteria bacterium]